MESCFRSYHFDLSAKSPRVAILEELKAKFGSDLRPDIVAVNRRRGR